MSPNKRYIGKLAPEQALELFHNMLEHMPVGVALFDGEFRMVAINQTALDMLDFPAELFSPQMPTLERVAQSAAVQDQQNACYVRR